MQAYNCIFKVLSDYITYMVLPSLLYLSSSTDELWRIAHWNWKIAKIKFGTYNQVGVNIIP